MEIVKTLDTLREKISLHKQKKIGFVPTMGFLHAGHLSLVETAKEENDIVVMSIFVNPLQFGPNEDFERYPRNEEEDILFAKEKGVDICFIPAVEEMYPKTLGIDMRVTEGTDVLCGKSRPGHFDGVAVVLSKLFHLVEPTNAYFGLKDAQQYAIVNTLVTSLNFPVNIIGLPTVREADGLAQSSRNVYLKEAERSEAVVLYQSLQAAREAIKNGEKDVLEIRAQIKQKIEENTEGVIDYIEVLSYPELAPIQEVDQQIIIALAVQFKQARLIDNIILSASGKQVMRIN